MQEFEQYQQVDVCIKNKWVSGFKYINADKDNHVVWSEDYEYYGIKDNGIRPLQLICECTI